MKSLIEKSESRWVLWAEAARIRHWTKNLLVFVPLITSHQLADGFLLLKAGIAFFSFSFCASGTYIVNDLLDVAEDRMHAEKKYRPIAKGILSVPRGVKMAGLFYAAGLVLAAVLSRDFVFLFGSYAAAAVCYSAGLKRIMFVDIMLLAVFYTARIFAGGIATGIPISSWLLVFSLFIFLSLALVKRVSELKALPEEQGPFLKGRGYSRNHLQLLTVIGAGAGCLSVIILAFYIHSAEALLLYARPGRLWFLCAVILYGIVRIWRIAVRGLMNQDPLNFALRDRQSYGAAVAAAVILLFAR